MSNQAASSNPASPLRDAAGKVQDDSKTVARLLGEVVADAQHLIRREFDLAKHEVRLEVDRARKGAIALGAAIAVLAAGGLALLFTAVYLLYELLDVSLWLSYLIVGIVMLVIGAGLLLWGRSKLQKLDPVPQQTLEETQKDVQPQLAEEYDRARRERMQEHQQGDAQHEERHADTGSKQASSHRLQRSPGSEEKVAPTSQADPATVERAS